MNEIPTADIPKLERVGADPEAPEPPALTTPPADLAPEKSYAEIHGPVEGHKSRSRLSYAKPGAFERLFLKPESKEKA